MPVVRRPDLLAALPLVVGLPLVAVAIGSGDLGVWLAIPWVMTGVGGLAGALRGRAAVRASALWCVALAVAMVAAEMLTGTGGDPKGVGPLITVVVGTVCCTVVAVTALAAWGRSMAVVGRRTPTWEDEGLSARRT